MTEVTIPDNPGRGRPPKSYFQKRRQFAEDLKKINKGLDFKASARGWAYLLEDIGEISKGQFDYVERLINKCREKGELPIDFVARDEAREFGCVENLIWDSHRHYVTSLGHHLLEGDWYDISFWKTQDYYLQLLVEKIDLKNLFKPICEKYNIPVATSKGWSPKLQRVHMIKRFHEWLQNGKQPVLLYCGDFDPVGMLISDKLVDNLEDLKKCDFGEIPLTDHDVEEVADSIIIDRFGLDYSFIQKEGLTWIENLETGSGKNLADPSHEDHDKDYVQNWLKKYGAKKVEANALVTRPKKGRDLLQSTIEKYLGKDPEKKYEKNLEMERNKVKDSLTQLGLKEPLERAVEVI